MTVSQQIVLSCYKMSAGFQCRWPILFLPTLGFQTPKVKRYLDSKKHTIRIQTPSQDVFGRLGCSSVSL